MIPLRTLKRRRVLIVGCGDVGLRCGALLRERWRVLALSRDPGRRAAIRAAGALPLMGDLDHPRSLARLSGLASRVIHLAPPQPNGREDHRTRTLLAVLGRGVARRGPGAARQRCIVPQRVAGPGARRSMPHAAPTLVYASTSGVYGDCGGAWIDETRPPRPRNERAARRHSAERQLRRAGARGVLRAAIMRAPGIYARERLPLARLARGTPALIDAQDVFHEPYPRGRSSGHYGARPAAGSPATCHQRQR